MRLATQARRTKQRSLVPTARRRTQAFAMFVPIDFTTRLRKGPIVGFFTFLRTGVLRTGVEGDEKCQHEYRSAND